MFDACVFNIFIDGKFYKIHIQSGTCAVQYPVFKRLTAGSPVRSRTPQLAHGRTRAARG
jgi:hypothetical protein